MNVKIDLNISNCTEEDLRNLNLIIGMIGERKLMLEKSDILIPEYELKIANLTLAIVYIENPNGGYNVFDYFREHFNVTRVENGGKKRISQFSMMEADYFFEVR